MHRQNRKDTKIVALLACAGDPEAAAGQRNMPLEAGAAVLVKESSGTETMWQWEESAV